MDNVKRESALLLLSDSDDYWDLQFESSPIVLRLRSGLYRIINSNDNSHEGIPAALCRPDHSSKWLTLASIRPSDNVSDIRFENPIEIDIAQLQPFDEVVVVAGVYPDTVYLQDEQIELQFLPSQLSGYFEIEVKYSGISKKSYYFTQESFFTFKDSSVLGDHRVRVRFVPNLARHESFRVWTPWSRFLDVKIYPLDSVDLAEQERVWKHKLALMAECDVKGVWTVTNPWVLPPSCPDNKPVKWFRTPCYDGASMLLNQEESYYCDPLAYYLSCIKSLIARGARFITWHDLIDGNFGKADLEIVLQFDVDAGLISMGRIYQALSALNVVASVMIHWECFDWYEYSIADVDISYLQAAERKGWAIGYHNNALGNIQRLSEAGNYSDQILHQACDRFRTDVLALRQSFNIRTFTHHGGNVLNRLTPIPNDLDITPVDKKFNPDLWKLIFRSFSDGGFVARPKPLQQTLSGFGKGRYFLRNHPLKYANYAPPFDVPPIDSRDLERYDGIDLAQAKRWSEREQAKQTDWLRLRNQNRLGQRLTHASPDKPISRCFSAFHEIQDRVETFRARRRPNFLRQYPWVLGDPRVFWWRMLQAFLPEAGTVLNVGALPPVRRDENAVFMSPHIKVLEMDIDPGRSPDILADVTAPPSDLLNTFDGVLLMGLPYVHSPSIAIQACHNLVRPSGLAMFGFAADTHPERGGLWHPTTRPVWSLEAEPLENIGLRGFLWSFGADHLTLLFKDWDTVEIEFFWHYWFVVCRKSSL